MPSPAPSPTNYTAMYPDLKKTEYTKYGGRKMKGYEEKSAISP